VNYFETKSESNRLEDALADLLIARLSLRAPAVWCFTYAIVLNSLVLSLGSWKDSAWIVPAIAFCGVMWLLFTLILLRSFVSVREILVGFGVVQAESRTKVFNWILFTPLLFAMVPGWVGSVATTALVLCLALFINKGQTGLVYASAIITIIGVAMLVASLFEDSVLSLGCAFVGFVGLVVLAVGLSFSNSFLRSFFRVESACAASSILLALPLSQLGRLRYASEAILLFGGLIVPSTLLLVAYTIKKARISLCRQRAANIRKALEYSGSLDSCEDQIRESDGYFRVCMPHYSHVLPESVGETGYISWPEHDNVAFPIREGNWFLARAITSTPNPLLTAEDQVGLSLYKLIEKIITDLVSAIGDTSLQSFCSRIFKPWHLRLYSGQDEREYFKMPWESGEILAIPRTLTCNFVYPTGSGVVDKEGLPCEVRSLRVQLSLREELLFGINPVGKSDESFEVQSVEQLIKLSWRVPLVIPSAYEGLLRTLVSEMKKWSTLDGVDQSTLLLNLSECAQECLGKHLSELMLLQITSVDVLQSAVSETDRDIYRKLQEYQQTLPGKKLGLVREFQVLARNAVYVQNEFILKTKVKRAIAEIIRNLDRGLADFDKSLAEGMRTTGSQSVASGTVVEGFEAARTLVYQDVLSFKQQISEEDDRLKQALNEIDQAFKRAS
jgi:hypothetical protein